MVIKDVLVRGQIVSKNTVSVIRRVRIVAHFASALDVKMLGFIKVILVRVK